MSWFQALRSRRFQHVFQQLFNLLRLTLLRLEGGAELGVEEGAGRGRQRGVDDDGTGDSGTDTHCGIFACCAGSARGRGRCGGPSGVAAAVERGALSFGVEISSFRSSERCTAPSSLVSSSLPRSTGGTWSSGVDCSRSPSLALAPASGEAAEARAAAAGRRERGVGQGWWAEAKPWEGRGLAEEGRGRGARRDAAEDSWTVISASWGAGSAWRTGCCGGVHCSVAAAGAVESGALKFELGVCVTSSSLVVSSFLPRLAGAVADDSGSADDD